MNKKLKTASTFAGVAVAGAIAGILFAPDKGASTRRKIIAKAKKAKASDKSDDAAEQKPIKWKADEDSMTSGNE
ncbi:MAG TPA: YtxH domain-containing protein [Puia sp.]|nr:YtxH domain-containing protein [Puia sp.]